MKRLVVGLLIAGAVACQAPEPSTAPMAKAGGFPTDTQLAQDSTAAILRVLRQVDLASAWGNATPETKEHGALEDDCGPDNFQMSFYYDRVRQDAQHPSVFHVWGRARHKKIITPLTATRLTLVPNTMGMTYATPKSVRAYTAFAAFVLQLLPKVPAIARAGRRSVFTSTGRARPSSCHSMPGPLGWATPPRAAACYCRAPGRTTKRAGNSPSRGLIFTGQSCPSFWKS